MFKKIFFILLISCLILPPAFALAQGLPPGTAAGLSVGLQVSCNPIKTFSQLIACGIQNIIKPLITLLFALSLVYFLWGVFKYVRSAGDPKMRDEGKGMMIYGIVAIFVMVSVWGLVNVLLNTFKLDNSRLPSIPSLPNRPVSSISGQWYNEV